MRILWKFKSDQLIIFGFMYFIILHFLWQLRFLKKILVFTWWVKAIPSFVVALICYCYWISQGFVSPIRALQTHFAVGLLIEWEDGALIYGCFALLSIKKDLVWGIMSNDSDNFTRPVRIVLALGKDHVIESKAVDHNKGRQIVCNSYEISI